MTLAQAARDGSTTTIPAGYVDLFASGGPLNGETTFSRVGTADAATRFYGSRVGYYQEGPDRTANFVVLSAAEDAAAQFDRQVGYGLLSLVTAGAGSGVVAGGLGLTSLSGFNLLAATTAGDSLVAGISGIPGRAAVGARSTVGTFVQDVAVTASFGGLAGVAGAGISSLVGRVAGNAAKEVVPDGIVYLRKDATGAIAPYGGQTTEANYLARQAAHNRAFPDSEFQYTIVDRAQPGAALDIAEHNFIQELTGGVAARRSPAVSNLRDPVGAKRRPSFGLPEPR